MAKIIATFDTVEKTIEVTMDGEKVKDIASIYLYSQYDDKEKGYVEMTSVESNDDEKLVRVTRVMANETTTTEEIKESKISKEVASLLK